MNEYGQAICDFENEMKALADEQIKRVAALQEWFKGELTAITERLPEELQSHHLVHATLMFHTERMDRASGAKK